MRKVEENDLGRLRVSGIKILNSPKIIKKKEVKQTMANKTELLKEIAKLQKAVERIPDSADKTEGEVGPAKDTSDDDVEEGLVLEKAGVGPGFQVYRDYSKGSKFNRLSR